MVTVRWTPGQSHLANALTKDNQEGARLLNGFRTSGEQKTSTLPMLSYLTYWTPEPIKINSEGKSLRKSNKSDTPIIQTEYKTHLRGASSVVYSCYE